MKLCPQCEFIYEDEQSFCDMDGTGLIHNSAADPPISRLIIPLVFDSASTPRHSGSIAAAALVVIALAGLVIAGYYTRLRQPLAQRYPEPAQSSLQADRRTQTAAAPELTQSAAEQSTIINSAEQTSNTQSNDATAAAPNQVDENSTATEASLARATTARARLNAGPVSASSESTNTNAPVNIRLTNGAVIKTDEAWSKKDGLWYRQAGVVTFVKRDRVRSIERAPVSTQSQSTSNGATTKKTSGQPAKSPDTRDRLHIARLEPVKPKKDSRVTSFLKKTGHLIKKPFRF